MRKLYVYGKTDVEDHLYILRFRTKIELNEWVERCPQHRIPIKATHPEVRRARRRMAADPTLTFPVEID